MSSRKLFIAAGIFHPEAGGPATYLYEILPHLQAREWDVRLLTYGDGDTDGYPYPVQRVPRRLLPLRMAQYAWKSRPLLTWADVVYAHTIDLPLMGSRAAPRIIKIVGDQAWERAIRKQWIPPTEDIDNFQTATYGTVVTQARRNRANQVRAMDGVIVPSQYLKRMVVGWGVDDSKVHVIYNALPPEHDTLDISQADARQQLGLDDRPTVLTAARLTAWKGVDHLISALSQVPDVRLLVAGDGPMKAQLEAQAQSLGDRVVFLGRVARGQMPLYMKAADYLALYSGYEGLSHTLLESLRVGTPVIASDKGGNPEVVNHDVNGLLVPYVDVDLLATTLNVAFQPGKRDQLAANSALGMERFVFERMVEQTSARLASYL